MTETTLMDAPEIALATFATLHDIGVQFAIDDFGTGYSSFAYLKRFPVDVLKIDQAFVHDIDHDDESQAIVSSILSLARTLGLEAVAEGVEREEQLDALAVLGCTRAQGFLVAPALPAGEFVEALRRSASGAEPNPRQLI
jgi:EAL domain-containing protein (putative c-di-GMP-specific phosphodiesterase class I)